MYVIGKTKRLLSRLDWVYLKPSLFLRESISILESILARMIPLIDSLVFSWSKDRLYRLMDSEDSLDDIIFTAFNYVGYWSYKDICPSQIPSEIKELIKEVNAISPSTMLEIGTYKGGTLYLWARSLDVQKIITIDLPEGYPPEKIKFFRLFDANKDFYFLRGNSHRIGTVNQVSQILKSDKVDFLFIDGGHSYEGVKLDFERYRHFVRDGGIVAFHDIVHPKLGVIKFWNEIKHKYPSKEIVTSERDMRKFARRASEKQGWAGIGVLYISATYIKRKPDT